LVWAQAQLPEGKTLPNGKNSDSHYFNNINGTEIDLTREQFPEGTEIPEGADKKKGHGTTRGYVLFYKPTRERYEILRTRVKECLKLLDK
jgi:hypothetical protein